jgi:hypothetical protein
LKRIFPLDASALFQLLPGALMKESRWEGDSDVGQ